MNPPKLFARSSYQQMLWKNGGGTTREIDRFPIGREPYLWRLSQARIERDGPFSAFPGYDRWLCVLTPEGILLNDSKLDFLRPHRFSGDASVECRVGQTGAEDLGLIFDRSKVDASMTVVEGPTDLSAEHAHYVFDLQSWDTKRYDEPATIAVAKSILISIRHK
jgi:environmental stress-induced protein Ves